MKEAVTILLLCGLLWSTSVSACSCDSVLKYLPSDSMREALESATIIDSAIWYIDTVLDKTKPSAAPDLAFDICEPQRVALFLLDSMCAVKSVLLATQLFKGEYRLFFRHEFLEKRFTNAGVVDRPIRRYKVLLVRGQECELRKLTSVR